MKVITLGPARKHVLTSSLLPGRLGGLSITLGSGGSAANMMPSVQAVTCVRYTNVQQQQRQQHAMVNSTCLACQTPHVVLHGGNLHTCSITCWNILMSVRARYMMSCHVVSQWWFMMWCIDGCLNL